MGRGEGNWPVIVYFNFGMAGYLSPAAYLYVEEQEYLQAYEDVLERYKGTWAPTPR